MQDDPIIEAFSDVLQNIEFAIIQTHNPHPQLLDTGVDRVLEGLERTYQNEQRNKPAP